MSMDSSKSDILFLLPLMRQSLEFSYLVAAITLKIFLIQLLKEKGLQLELLNFYLG